MTDEQRFIFSTTDYFDDQGHQIRMNVVMQGTPPEDFCAYASFGQLVADTPVGRVARQFVVPLPLAKTLDEAFDQLDDAMEAAKEEQEESLKEFVQEQLDNRHKILTPAQLEAMSEAAGMQGPGTGFPRG